MFKRSKAQRAQSEVANVQTESSKPAASQVGRRETRHHQAQDGGADGGPITATEEAPAPEPAPSSMGRGEGRKRRPLTVQETSVANIPAGATGLVMADGLAGTRLAIVGFNPRKDTGAAPAPSRPVFEDGLPHMAATLGQAAKQNGQTPFKLVVRPGPSEIGVRELKRSEPKARDERPASHKKTAARREQREVANTRGLQDLQDGDVAAEALTKPAPGSTALVVKQTAAEVEALFVLGSGDPIAGEVIVLAACYGDCDALMTVVAVAPVMISEVRSATNEPWVKRLTQMSKRDIVAVIQSWTSDSAPPQLAARLKRVRRPAMENYVYTSYLFAGALELDLDLDGYGKRPTWAQAVDAVVAFAKRFSREYAVPKDAAQARLWEAALAPQPPSRGGAEQQRDTDARNRRFAAVDVREQFTGRDDWDTFSDSIRRAIVQSAIKPTMALSVHPRAAPRVAVVEALPPPISAQPAMSARKSLTTPGGILALSPFNAMANLTRSEPDTRIVLPFILQTAQALTVLEDSFPGITVAMGAIPSTAFACLYSGAVELMKRRIKVDLYYRTCPSIADDGLWSSGPSDGRASPQSWGMTTRGGFAPPLLQFNGKVAGPKSVCRDTPDGCGHLGINPADKVMMFGLSDRADEYSPDKIAPWCRRFEKVITVVPNPYFKHFRTTRTRRGFELCAVGDAQPLVIPAQHWYDSKTDYAMVSAGGWLSYPRDKLVWRKSPLGSAFILVEFSIEPGAGGLLAGSILPPLPEEVLLDVPYDEFGGSVARQVVVDKVERVIAGRPANDDTRLLAVRTAARVIGEEGAANHARAGDEATAAAEIAFNRLNTRRLSWWALSAFSDLVWGRPSDARSLDLWRYRPLVAALGVGALALTLGRPKLLGSIVESVRKPTSPYDWAIYTWVVQWTHAVVLAPVYEEALKRAHWSVTPILASWELFAAVLRLGPADGLAAYAPTGIMHFASAAAPYLYGVTMHAAWNANAMGLPTAYGVDYFRRTIDHWNGLSDPVDSGKHIRALLSNPRPVPDITPLTSLLWRGDFSGLRHFWAFPPGCVCGVRRKRPIGSWLRDPRVIAGSVATCTVSPIVEEAAKHGPLGGLSTAVILAYEAHREYRRDGLAALVPYLPTAAMHVAAYALPLPAAVLLHCCWNVLATVCPPGSLLDTKWYQNSDLGVVYAVCASEYDDGSLAAIASPQLSATPPYDAKPCVCDDKPASVLCGVGLRIARPLIFRSCAHNEGAALRLRMAAPVLWTNPQVTAFWDVIHANWRREPLWDTFRGIVREDGGIRPMCFVTWSAKYPRNARLALTAAAVESARGFDRQDYRIKAFTKVEHTPLLIEAAVSIKKPRLIQGRSPAITSSCGPTMAALGKCLRRACDADTTADHVATYAGGWSADQVGSWYSSCVTRGLQPYSFDVSAWDASVGPGPTTSWSMDVNDLGPRHQVQRLMASRQHPKMGSTLRGWQYRLEYEVCSGDPDTTVGNSVNHMKIWLQLHRELVDNGRHEPHTRLFRVLVAGDNSIVMVDAAYLDHLVPAAINVFERAGFTLKAESTLRGVEHGIFCSGRLYEVGPSEHVYGPKIGRVLAKTFYLVNGDWDDRRNCVRWMRAVAQSLENTCCFIPVLRAVVEAVLRDTADVSSARLPRDDEPWRMRPERRYRASDETWTQMAHIYSCTASDIFRLEQTILQHNFATSDLILTDPLVEHIAMVDLT